MRTEGYVRCRAWASISNPYELGGYEPNLTKACTRAVRDSLRASVIQFGPIKHTTLQQYRHHHINIRLFYLFCLVYNLRVGVLVSVFSTLSFDTQVHNHINSDNIPNGINNDQFLRPCYRLSVIRVDHLSGTP